MSSPSILHRQHTLTPAPPRRFEVQFEPAVVETAPRTRDRIWDLSPSLHCSVIGTCLTTGDLRQLLAKLNEPDARTASDHDLHGRVVSLARQPDFAGKLLHKALDRRHETHVKRFAKAKNAAEVRRLWAESLERGDIPGAYWAVLTHPAATPELVQEVFGEVHMLSHLVGMSNRADIARLRRLEQDLDERDDKILRQEARLERAAQDKAELLRRLETLEIEARQRPAPAAPDAAAESAVSLNQKLADERARSALVATRAEEQARALKLAHKQVALLEERVLALEADLTAVETTLDEMVDDGQATPPAPADLKDIRLLYVGGRPRLIDQLRALVSRRGGVLLSHDGGLEDKSSLLPGLISQADAAYFPVDCVSHHAAEQVKRLCRDASKPFVPLRSASLASFIAALARLEPAAGASLEPAE